MTHRLMALVLSVAALPVSMSGGGQDCLATGIGSERSFAERVCEVAPSFGLPAEEVHSYGGGGIDVFISQAAGRRLQSVINREHLTEAVRSLAAWTKRNYTGFNQVEVTVVSGDDAIARGVTEGTNEIRVTVY